MSIASFLALSKFLQHELRDTSDSLQTSLSGQPIHCESVGPLQSEPDISMARHRFKGLTVPPGHVGLAVGRFVGGKEGRRVGDPDGGNEGSLVGELEGPAVGCEKACCSISIAHEANNSAEISCRKK